MPPLLHGKARQIALAALALGVAGVVARRLGGHATGRHVPGGVLTSDAGSYDMHSRVLFGSLFREIAADVAATAPNSARILEVGSGPGHLALQLAREHGLDVTGLDLPDQEMVMQAGRVQWVLRWTGGPRRPTIPLGADLMPIVRFQTVSKSGPRSRQSRSHTWPEHGAGGQGHLGRSPSAER